MMLRTLKLRLRLIWYIILGRSVAYKLVANLSGIKIERNTLLVDCYTIMPTDGTAFTVVGGHCTFINCTVIGCNSAFMTKEAYDRLLQGDYDVSSWNYN